MSQSMSQLVVFKLSNELFGVSITQIKEIIRMTEISKLPDMPKYIPGVINLRGKVHAIYDLRSRFGMETKATDDNTKIIITNEKKLGFIVDEVTEIIRAEESDIEDIADLSTGLNKKYIAGIVKKDENIVVLIDLDKVLSNKEDSFVKQATAEVAS